MKWHSIVSLLVLSISGCAVVEIKSKDGAVTVERHGGVLAVMLDPSDDVSHVIEASGIGVIIDPYGTTVGYGNSKLVTMNSNCQLLVVPEDEGQSRKLRQLLSELRDVCIANEMSGDGYGL